VGSVFVYLPTTNKQTERLFTSPFSEKLRHIIIYWDVRGIFHGRLEASVEKQDKLSRTLRISSVQA
jgi:hypothetical protein